MENLLRRARSKGIGLFLATQSPGDLDYKCRDQIRTWLIGRVKEKVAIADKGDGHIYYRLIAPYPGSVAFA